MARWFDLIDGQRLPAIGFGTWEITPDERAAAAVAAALQSGYRLIDTARIYGNEAGVGLAVRESGVPRTDIQVTTKIWNDDQGYERTLEACTASLKRLGLDYLDLYLIHWPATSRRGDSWRALEQLQKDGKVRSIGVANFTIKHLQQLLAQGGPKPAVNQVEFHPFIYEQQRPLLEFCREQGIVVEAYSPIKRVAHEGNAVIEGIAGALGRPPTQITLRWCHQHDTLPLPRSKSSEHIRSNYEIFDFELSPGDMAALDSLSDGERVTWDPAGMG